MTRGAQVMLATLGSTPRGGLDSVPAQVVIDMNYCTREAGLPDVVLDESALAKVGALAQPGQHSALAAGGLGDDDGALLDDVEAVPALALPEDGLPSPELHRLQRARDQLPVVLQRPLQTFALLQSAMGSEQHTDGLSEGMQRSQAIGARPLLPWLSVT